MTMPTNTLPSASQLRDYSSSPNIAHVVADNGDGTFTISPQAGTAGAAHVYAATLSAGEDVARDLLKVVNEWNYTPINANGATTVVTGSGSFWGIVVIGAAGTVNVDAYDNTAASGQKLVAQFSAAAATQKPALAGTAGIKFGTGLTINCSADPTDAQILAIWR